MRIGWSGMKQRESGQLLFVSQEIVKVITGI
jgi:hypothetical protein